MSMITPRILVSAAHCFAAQNSMNGELAFAIGDIWALTPGVKVSEYDNKGAVQVKHVVLVPDYANFFDGPTNDTRGQKDDIAFLFLSEELVSGYSIPVANADEVKIIKANQHLLEHFGYGGQRHNFGDTGPYRITAPARPQGAASYFFNHAASDEKTLVARFNSGTGVCGGDSGGPVYSSINGVTKLVAVIVGGGGCREGNTPPNDSLLTIVYPYLSLMNSEFEKFLEREKQEAAAKAKLEAEAAAKAKLEAEAAAKAKLEAEAAAKTTTPKRRSTLWCAKGKTVKKVTAVNPKCPRSYKRVATR
jgi:hypothetical protein